MVSVVYLWERCGVGKGDSNVSYSLTGFEGDYEEGSEFVEERLIGYAVCCRSVGPKSGEKGIEGAAVCRRWLRRRSMVRGG